MKLAISMDVVVFHSKENAREKKLIMGKKKFNMNPSKVRDSKRRRGCEWERTGEGGFRREGERERGRTAGVCLRERERGGGGGERW